jgi:hypothetical protein
MAKRDHGSESERKAPLGHEDVGGSKIPSPKDDNRGDAKPGFGDEGPRSELGDATSERRDAERRRIAEHNRQREAEKERREK